MSRIAIAIVLAALVATTGVAADPQYNDAPNISATALHALRESGVAPVVIDVRTAEEYAAGHIPGAVNIPFDQIAQRIAEVDAPHGVALY